MFIKESILLSEEKCSYLGQMIKFQVISQYKKVEGTISAGVIISYRVIIGLWRENRLSK